MNARAAEHIGHVYHVATSFSRESRALLADYDREFVVSEPPGCGDEWAVAIRERTEDGRAAAIRDHLKQLVACAAPAERAAVRAVVRELRRAVDALARYRADYECAEVTVPARIAKRLSWRGTHTVTYYRPVPAAVAELDRLRRHARVQLIACEEMFARHRDPMARMLATAARASVVLCTGPDSGLLADWFMALAAGDAA